MEARTLGLRLRAARRARGLRQEDAAKALGLPRTAVTQIESGNRSVSTLELTRLSKLYFRPISDLLREAPSDESDDVLTALNRAAPELKDDQDLQERVADCLLLCSYGTEFAQLLEILPRPRPTCYAMPEPRSPRESMIQGEEVAKQERRRLGIGNAQIADVAGLIASQGVWTTGIRFPDHISSLLVRHATIGSAILVNATLPTEDRRLAHAHAYAHLLHKRDCSVTVSLAKDLSETSEDQASAFAMAFLMPEEGIRNFLQSTGKSARGRRRQFAKDGASRSPAKAGRSAPRNSQAINCRIPPCSPNTSVSAIGLPPCDSETLDTSTQGIVSNSAGSMPWDNSISGYSELMPQLTGRTPFKPPTGISATRSPISLSKPIARTRFPGAGCWS